MPDIRMIKYRPKACSTHWEMRNALKISVGNPEGKTTWKT
jgi:hypothetical protein